MPQKNSTPLFPICEDGLFGYIDPSGDLAIDLMFYKASCFSEGMACVEFEDEEFRVFDSNAVGFIDEEGLLAIGPASPRKHPLSLPNDPSWSYATSMRDGQSFGSATCEDLGGYIDCDGDLVIPVCFKSAFDFSEGLAAVIPKGRGRKYGFIDRSGDLVIPPAFDFAHAFSEGLCSVCLDGDSEFGTWGYCDRDGEIVIAPVFSCADEFANGVARVVTRDHGQTAISLIDRKGERIIDEDVDQVTGFAEGVCYIEIRGRKSLVSPDGNEIVALDFDRTTQVTQPFSEGRALIQVGGETHAKYGFVDTEGNVVISPIFDDAENFSSGLALVKSGDRTGYVNRDGEFVWSTCEWRS